MAADAKSKGEEVKVLLRNKKARHDFFVEWTVEAGLVLQGSEVKSLREARAVMSDAYAMVRNGEAWLINMQVTEYPWANRWNHEPKRDRKLLLHAREIKKLEEASAQSGYTILPLEVYLKGGRIKALLGVCKGKKLYDKRQDQKRRDAEREVEAALRRR
jgi:SsrA-binding protein